MTRSMRDPPAEPEGRAFFVGAVIVGLLCLGGVATWILATGGV